MKVQVRSAAAIETLLKTQDKIRVKNGTYIQRVSIPDLIDPPGESIPVHLNNTTPIESHLRTQDKIHVKSSGYIKPQTFAALLDVNIVNPTDESFIWYNFTNQTWEVTDIVNGGTY